MAAFAYGLDLERCSNRGFDARTAARQTVEIKLTGGDSVSISSDCEPPDFLIVLRFAADSGFAEIYNGEFPVELWRRKRASKRRVVSLRLTELKKLKPAQAIEAKNSLEELNRLFISA